MRNATYDDTVKHYTYRAAYLMADLNLEKMYLEEGDVVYYTRLFVKDEVIAETNPGPDDVFIFNAITKKHAAVTRENLKRLDMYLKKVRMDGTIPEGLPIKEEAGELISLR